MSLYISFRSDKGLNTEAFYLERTSAQTDETSPLQMRLKRKARHQTLMNAAKLFIAFILAQQVSSVPGLV